jgi:hypothetical protein
MPLTHTISNSKLLISGVIKMKKVLISLILITSVYGSVEHSTVNAATGSTSLKPVTVELTINSFGAGGSQFTLKGLQTPASPDYVCTKTSVVSAATGDGTSVKFALVDIDSVDNIKITVKGTTVGKLAVINDSYIDQSGNASAGRISVRLIR